MKYRRRVCSTYFLLGIFLGGQGGVLCPARAEEVPQLLRLNAPSAYLSLGASRSVEDQTATGGTSGHVERTDFTPVVGMGLGGAFYHSSLLNFSLNGELGRITEKDHSRSTDPDGITTSVDHSTKSPYDQYDLKAVLLGEKPYVTTAEARRYTTRRDTDVFTRSTYETTDEIFTSGYNAGPVPFQFTAEQFEDKETDTANPLSNSRNSMSLSASNTRKEGVTAAFWGQSDTQQRGDKDEHLLSDGSSSAFSIKDTEQLPGRTTLESELDYNEYTQTLFDNPSVSSTNSPPGSSRTLDSKQMIWSEDLTLNHSDRLDSSYHYSLTRQEWDGVETDWNQLSAQLNHRLYDSLYSSVFTDYWKSDDTTSGTERYGAGLSESYVKHLQDWGLLNAGLSSALHHETRDSGSSGSSQVLNEIHKLSDSQVTFLNQSGVDSGSIVVTDSKHSVQYREGIDYEVINRGGTVEIRRLPGSHIPEGGGISVSYSIVSNPAGTSDTRTDSVSSRLSLWQGLLSFYGSYGSTHVDQEGGEILLTDTEDRLFGIDSVFGPLRVGAEYQEYQSNLSSFQSARFIQEFSRTIGDASNIRLTARQSLTTYDDNDDDRLETESYSASYSTRLARSLTWSASAGERFENRSLDESDSTQLFANSDINFNMGLTSIRIGYEYRDDDYTFSSNRRHFISANVRRSF